MVCWWGVDEKMVGMIGRQKWLDPPHTDPEALELINDISMM